MIRNNCCYFGISNTKNIIIEVTSYCNLKCIHCHSYSYNNTHLKPPILNNILGNIINYYNSECKAIITGGEPLLHPQLEDILNILYKKRIEFDICTNGLLLNEKKLDTFIDMGLREISISLDGDKKSHEKIRGSNTYNKVINTIEILSKKDIPFEIIAVVNNITLSHLSNVIEVSKKYGAKKTVFEGIIPFGRARRFEKKLFKKDEINIDEQKIKINYYRISNGFYPLTNCQAYTNLISIKPNGKIGPCPLIYHTSLSDLFWDYSEKNFTKSFNNSYNRWIELLNERHELCSDCNFSDNCGKGCPASSLAYYGDYKKLDPLCPLGGNIL